MPCYIASDHAGFELKEFLRERLGKGFDLVDLGVFSEERVDYPMLAAKLAEKLAAEKDAKGILVCGTGIGMSIAANKVKGVRAAVVYDEFTAKMARQHNDANVACLGARNLGEEDALSLAKLFLETGFDGSTEAGERHLKRVRQIQGIEEANFK